MIEVDGLADNWEKGIPSDWELISKSFDSRMPTPFAIRKLNSSLLGMRDNTTMVRHLDYIDSAPCFDKYIEDGKRIVAKMPLGLFRHCLINQFDIRFHMKTIEWPSHIKKRTSLSLNHLF